MGEPLLYEFAFTPDVFRIPGGSRTANAVALRQLLEGVQENGLIANLHKEAWIAHVRNISLSVLSDSALRAELMELLEALENRHRLVRHPRSSRGVPSVDRDWFDIAMDSHRREAFRGIVVSDTLYPSCIALCPQVLEIVDAPRSPLWRHRKRTATVERTERGYREALAPFLRYARAIDLVDPYLSPPEPPPAPPQRPRFDKHFAAVRLTLEQLGARDPNASRARLHVHVGNPNRRLMRHDAGSIRTLLSDWQRAIEPLLSHGPKHMVRVFLWDNDPPTRSPRFHDRFLLTDQIGISIPGGLDCHDVTSDTTDWSVLDDDVRRRRLDEYDEQVGIFHLLGKLEMSRDGSTITP